MLQEKRPDFKGLVFIIDLFTILRSSDRSLLRCLSCPAEAEFKGQILVAGMFWLGDGLVTIDIL